MTTTSRRRVLPVAALILVACSSRTAPSSGAAPDAESSSSNLVVTGSELARYGEGLQLQAVLERARPWFLTGRGATPMVSVDGSPPTDLSILASIPVVQVREVRLQRASFGTGRSAFRANGDLVAGDVLLVATRRR